MAVPNSSTESTFRLADRLVVAGRKRFVGRAAERELLRSALQAAEPSFALLYLYGPGGIGKTTLLSEYAAMAAENGLAVIRLDGHNLEPSPAGFLTALRLALGLTPELEPLATLAQSPRPILLLDTYEMLSPLDAWLRNIFLPQLPANGLVVMAGRKPPAPAWRVIPGWGDFVRVISLRNLRPDESRAYLSGRGVPEQQQPAALEFTHGHPLALSLVADVLGQAHQSTLFNPLQEPDVLHTLLDRFIEQTPSPRHRQALEICAHVRVTSEGLLAETLASEDAADLFEWLRCLSFIEQGAQGLFPHDLAREVLDADLRWRNPEGYYHLHRQVRLYIVRRLLAAQGVEQQRLFFDLLYLHRNSPIMKPFFEWQTLGHMYAEPAVRQDFAAITDIANRHGGQPLMQWVQHWQKCQPHAFIVFRGGQEQALGFAATLDLHLAAPEEIEADPATQAAWNFVQCSGSLRPGEEVIYHRFFSGRDTYQSDLAIHSLVAMTTTTHWLSRPRLAWSFLNVAEPEFWQPMMSYLNMQRSPHLDFTLGEQPYGVFSHNWRAEPALAWLDLLEQRELATNLTLEQLKAKPAPALVVLSQPEFEEAVRQAIRNYTRPDILAASPLLRSRLVADRAGPEATTAALQTLLYEAAQSLTTTPKDEKLYRALWRTYFEPAPTQEAAAEILNLPFSTYRFHLSSAIKRLIGWLWQRELNGFEP